MFDQVSFASHHGLDTYVLMRVPTLERPWPSSARFEPLDSYAACRVLLASITDRLENPNWRVLQLLGIEEHPANLHASDLERTVREHMEGLSSRFVVYRLLRSEPPTPVSAPRTELERDLPPPQPQLTFIEIEAFDSNTRPVPNLECEIILASGEPRRVRLDRNGFVRLDEIKPGACKLRLLGCDRFAWKGDAGTEPQAVSGSVGTSRVHRTAQGEVLATIARRYGFSNWSAVWMRPENRALREKRATPDVLAPGDEIFIPALELGELTVSAGARHRLAVLTQPQMYLRLSLLDDAHSTLDDVSCELVVEGDTLFEGAASGGLLECEIPVGVQQARLTLQLAGQTVTRVLRIGHLDPPDEIAGAQARLANLGRYTGPVDGSENASFISALRDFRRDAGLADSSELDAEAANALRREHAS